MIWLLPSIPVKENRWFPTWQLEGWQATAAGLLQRKSVVDLAVQALSWDGAEPNFQPYTQMVSVCQHFTWDQYSVKSKVLGGEDRENQSWRSVSSTRCTDLLPCKGSNCKGLTPHCNLTITFTSAIFSACLSEL